MKEEGIIAERRRYDRLEKEFAFRYTVIDDLTDATLDEMGLILDISGGGLRFLSSRRWRKNEQLLMKLDFEGWQIDDSGNVTIQYSGDCTSMLVIGAVMWSAETAQEDQFEIGIRFTARMHRDQ
ncbi:MAG: PilZ domain-containing protein [Proteobacteria bacterium]|nr:PilZ domain-containing protein [Pseudomonadota bacterium]MBU4296587.1 PilZ domain-containing protein [Pseudomonadota bacterium]MCG2748216.1 PilZ domain-containing protein [Desulfobulbaceae bacterium]